MVESESRYTWLVFDADGTLFDFHRGETEALKSTALAHDVPYTADLHDAYGAISDILWARFELGELPLDDLKVMRFERLFGDLGIDLNAERFNFDYMRELGRQTQLLPGAESLIERLAPRFRLLLATNGIASVQRSRFAHSSIRRFFEDVVISDEIGVAKPQREYMDEAFSRMGYPSRSEVLMIGDKLSSDIAGGVEYGIDTCWFNPGGLSLDGGPQPTFIISDLSQIEAIVCGK
jgi:YjjG family noncanonical pyrimidine nucleotidase